MPLPGNNSPFTLKSAAARQDVLQSAKQITFSGEYALESQQEVYFITERAVFKLTEQGVTLIEIAPGVDLENDILSHMEFKPHIAENLCEMDKRLFEEAPMGLTLTE